MIFRAMQPPDRAQLSWLPNVRLMFNVNHNRDAEFELVVRSFIEGLHAQLTRNRNTSAHVQSMKRSRRVQDGQHYRNHSRSTSRKRANRKSKD
jgi:hypothetical protein